MKTIKSIEKKPVVKVESKKEVEVKDFSLAIVKNGKYEVRRYTQEDHGDNFAELANEFASKKGYQVELV